MAKQLSVQQHGQPQSSYSPADAAAPRVLIIRLSAHGDVIQTLPLLGAIKQHFPNAWVGWLTETSAAELLENHPLIDQLYVCERQRWLKAIKPVLAKPWCWPRVFGPIWSEIQALIEHIQADRYEVSLDVQGLLKSALWPWLAGIPLRVGYQKAREGAHWLYNRFMPPYQKKNCETPDVEQYLGFMQAVESSPPATPAEGVSWPFPLAPVPEESQRWADAQIAQIREDFLHDVSKGPIIALAPGTRWPSKQWPLPYWQNLLQELLARPCAVLVLGGPDERAFAHAMLSPVEVASFGKPAVPLQGGFVNLVGKTSWPQLQALLGHVDVLVGPDSAPMHLAQAVAANTLACKPRIVSLFGPTSPERTGPIDPRHLPMTTTLACQPCFERTCPLQHHACMQTLSVDSVMTATRQQLAELRVEAQQKALQQKEVLP